MEFIETQPDAKGLCAQQGGRSQESDGAIKLENKTGHENARYGFYTEFGATYSEIGEYLLPDFTELFKKIYKQTREILGPNKRNACAIWDTSVLFPPIQVEEKPNIDIFADILNNLSSIGEHAEYLAAYCSEYANRLRTLALSFGGGCFDEREYARLFKFFDIFSGRCSSRLIAGPKEEIPKEKIERWREVTALFRDLSQDLNSCYADMEDRLKGMRVRNGLEGVLDNSASDPLFGNLFRGFLSVSSKFWNGRKIDSADADAFLLATFLYLASLKKNPVFLFTADYHLNKLMMQHDAICRDCGIPVESKNAFFVYYSFAKEEDHILSRISVREY